jgi:hypothetical protein
MYKKVKVISGSYKDIKGTIRGVTIDGYWMVMPANRKWFWVKTNELMVLE